MNLDFFDLASFFIGAGIAAVLAITIFYLWPRFRKRKKYTKGEFEARLKEGYSGLEKGAEVLREIYDNLQEYKE